ncbi:hypothetical protein ACGFMK_19405 [Amycolatopsis sp. NPDC049252]|uniref:hypothetical protein n=1 Tax=Amycolatopsis sp. NPDC049252 TaxID=3363933 RepID=UPI0037236A98
MARSLAGPKVTHTGLVGGEAMPAKLVDGVAAGPKPPTDGKVGESRTAHEAFSVSGDRIEMGCTRASATQETVPVTQTIYRYADFAAVPGRGPRRCRPGDPRRAAGVKTAPPARRRGLRLQRRMVFDALM